ncbi:MAG: guanylate kinase [Pseudomonadota bacterium]
MMTSCSGSFPMTSKSSRGHRFIISAPSGTGKTTLCRALRQRFPDIRYSVSYTTRLPREGERDGVDYHFITREAFETRLARGLWAEWARVHDNYYGTDAEFLEKSISAGQDVLLDIDVQGAEQILNRFPDSVTVFIMPPSMTELERRLTQRGTEAPAVIERRLMNAASEMARKDLYRHVIVNDRLDEAISAFIALISAYREGKTPSSSPVGGAPGGLE